MIRRRPALALLALLPFRAKAQPAPPPPAAAPPPPVQLPAATPNGPAPPPPPPLALPPGVQALAVGWRVRFSGEAAAIDDPAVPAALAEIGRRLAATPGRVSLLAQASGPVGDVSTARRTSLARALTVKQALAAGGLAETRIDVRALGRTAEALDAVDILPPEAQPGRAQR